MTALTYSARRATGAVWTGPILSGVAIAFLLLDAAMKLAGLVQVTDTMRALGWPADMGTLRMLGTLQLGATLLYAYPRTAVMGAVLLTGYLGGAVATHLRIDSPLFTHVLFGVYLGLFVWGGLWLRRPALRALLRGDR